MNQADNMDLANQSYYRRGARIMTQGLLSFKFEAEKETAGMTGLAGLPVYLDPAQVVGLSKSIQRH